MTKFLSRHKYWVFVIILFIFLRLPSLFEPYWYGDEGIYLTLGQAITKGDILYRQIHDNKPPTLYYLAAISQTVFGFRLLLALFMIPTVYFFYRLCLYFFTPKTAKISLLFFVILTSLPTLEGNIANAEIFMLLPTILAFYFFTQAKKNTDYLCIGFLLGLAFTIKIPVFIEAGFLILWVSFQKLSRRRKWSSFIPGIFIGLGFLIPTFIYFLYFYSLDALKPFLSSAILQNFSYLSSWTTGNQSSSAASGGLIYRLAALLILWFIIYILFRRRHLSLKTTFILSWLMATIFGALLSARPYPHYLIQILPPLCLLIGLFFLKTQTKSLIPLILGLMVVAFSLVKYKFYFYPTLSYYSHFYSFKGIPYFHDFFGSHVVDVYQISDYISQNSLPDDRIFIWGDHPYIYALSDRLPPGRYTVAYHVVDFNGYQETLDSFKAHPPKFVVYYPMSQRSFPELDSLLDRYYSLDQSFGSTLVFKKR